MRSGLSVELPLPSRCVMQSSRKYLLCLCLEVLYSSDQQKELTVRLCFVNFDGSVALKASEAVGLENPLPDDFC